MIFPQAVAGIKFEWIFVLPVVLLLCFFAVVFFSFQQIFRLWLQAFMSQANVPLFELIGMKLRRMDAKLVVDCRIMSVQAGHPVSMRDLQIAQLSGADLEMVTRAWIDAQTSGKDFTFEELVEAERSQTLAKLLGQ